MLKDVGLVGVEARAQQRLCGLRPKSIKQLHSRLDRYRRIWEEQFDQLRRRHEKEFYVRYEK